MRPSLHATFPAIALFSFLGGAALILPPAVAEAVLPDTLSYQGRLTSAGLPVPDSTGNTVTFRIFDAASSGTQIWAEEYSAVTNTARYVSTKNGLFSVVLGSYSPLSAVPFDKPYWLQVEWYNALTPGTETLTPRQPLTNAPYAFRAKYVDNASVPVPLSLTGNQNSGSIINAYNFASTGAAISGSAGTASGVYGSGSPGVTGEGITGVVGNGASQGVQGNSPSNTGVYGAGGTAGVMGTATTGYGVRGQGGTASGMAGVYGQSSASGLPAYGVQGDASAGNINDVGVLGRYNGAVAPGVLTAGAGVAGVDDDLNGVGVFGKGGSGSGGFFRGLTGVAGMASSAGGVGVWARQNSGAYALVVSGSSQIGGSGDTSTFGPGSTVNFTGATVNGISTSVPLSLTLASAASSPLSVSNASGAAAVFTGGTGLVAQGSSSGLYAFNNSTYAAGTAVLARSALSGSGIGVYGTTEAGPLFPPSSGAGVFGESAGIYGTGVAGYANGTYGVGVSGGTISPGGFGVAGSNISASSGGAGVYGYTNYSASAAGVLGAFGTTLPSINVAAGVYGYAINSNAYGVYSMATSTGSAAVGALGGAVGVSATALGASGIGVQGAGSTGVAAFGTSVGISATSNAGLGVYAQGLTAAALAGNSMGISVTASGNNGVGIFSQGGIGIIASGGGGGGRFFGTQAGANGVFARGDTPTATGLWAENPFGGQAMVVSGNAQFGYPSGGANIRFLSGNTVDFTGATVLGLSGGVTPPVTWSINSSQPVLTVSNTGSAAGVSASATNGSAVVAASQFSDAVTASTQFGNRAIYAYNGNPNPQVAGVMGQTSATTGIGLAGFGGVTNTVLPTFGSGVYGSGIQAGMVGNAGWFAPPAPPQSTGVYGYANGLNAVGLTGYSPYQANSSGGVGVAARGGYLGLSATALDTFSGVGLMASGRTGALISATDSGFGAVLGASITAGSTAGGGGSAVGLGVFASSSSGNAIGATITAYGNSGPAIALKLAATGTPSQSTGLLVQGDGQMASLQGLNASSSGLLVNVDLVGVSVTSRSTSGLGLYVSATTGAVINSVSSNATNTAIAASAQNGGFGSTVTAGAFTASAPFFGSQGNAIGVSASASGDSTGIGVFAAGTHRQPGAKGIGVLAMGDSYGVYAKVTINAYPNLAVGLAAESYQIGLSATALEDASPNTRTAIYAIGRTGITVLSDMSFLNFNPLGLSLTARNTSFSPSSLSATGGSIYAEAVNNSTGQGFANGLLINALATTQATGLSVSAVVNGSSLQSATGILGQAAVTTSSGPAVGVFGFGTSSSGAAIGVSGTGQGNSSGVVGVKGGIQSLGYDGRAGVAAVNQATASVGTPQTALDIDGGLTMRTSRSDPSAGISSVGVNSTTGLTGTSWFYGNGSGSVGSSQIVSNSIILLTIQESAWPANSNFSVTLSSVSNGFFSFQVSALSPSSFSGSVTVHWLVINQR